MRNQFKIGKKYTIQFWDHCIGSGAVLTEVTLWITKEDKNTVYGTWWKVLNEESETEEENREMVSIVKSAVLKKLLLKEL